MIVKVKERFFEELVLKVEPDAYILREVLFYTVVRPRTLNDPTALIPRVILSGIEYSPEAAWRSALYQLLKNLQVEIPVGATRGDVRKLIDEKLASGINEGLTSYSG
jgi:isocitrate dehydrogenase kinase/phosphatase